MKNSILFLVGILSWLSAYEQNIDVLQVDKLKRELAIAKTDSSKALIMTQLAESYRDRVTDTCFYYAQNALELSRRIVYPAGETKALLALSHYFHNRGNLTQGLELGLKALEIAKKYDFRYDQAFAMIRIGNVYMSLKDYHEALKYYHQTRQLTKNSPVNEKQKRPAIQAGEIYEPKVSVSTEKKNGAVIIKVIDNGVGIPEGVVQKIYQPFFTTKPTGEGTGLGLSLSYDIITKGHGGQMKVETKEGEGTTFIIQLPKNIL
ncbi:MAG: ATP-binding protein [Chitinophagaceae bacterium]